MNPHVPQEIQERWPTYEWRGTVFEVNGKKYIRALHRTLNMTHFYDFENDFFWWNAPEHGHPERNNL